LDEGVLEHKSRLRRGTTAKDKPGAGELIKRIHKLDL